MLTIFPSVAPERYFEFLIPAQRRIRDADKGCVNFLGSGITTSEGVRFLETVRESRLYLSYLNKSRDAVLAGISDRYRETFHVPRNKRILACQGASIGLAAVALALYRRNRTMHLLCPIPNYGAIPELMQTWQIHVITCKHDAVPKLISNESVVLVSEPNNPRGSRYSDEWVAAIFHALRRFPSAMLICDKVFHDCRATSPLKPFSGESQLIEVDSLSKAYGLKEAKCGFIVATAEIIRDVESAYHSMAGELAIGSIVEGICAMDRINELNASVTSHIAVVKAIVDRRLAALAQRGLISSVIPNDRGISFVEIVDATDTYDFCSHCCANHCVAVTPGRYFDFRESKSVRIGWGRATKEEVESGLARLELAMKSFRDYTTR